MASTKFKKRDLNRYRKIYPYLRRKPVFRYCADKEVVIEIGAVTFTGSSVETHVFSETFTSVPTVTTVAHDYDENSSADVNVFITSVTTTEFTVSTSQAFTGRVEFHAMWVAP